MTTDMKLRSLAVAMRNTAREAARIQQDFDAASLGFDMSQLAAATGESEHYVTVMRGYAAQAAYLTAQASVEEAR